MSLYNIMHSVKPATFFLLPMLGKHPDEYPGFRDTFAGSEEIPEYNGYIHVYTRTGGDNRESYSEEIAEIQAMTGFVTDFDDSFDRTFMTFIFEVPDEFKEDFIKIMAGKLNETSQGYKDRVIEVYPKLKDRLTERFSG